LGIAFVGLAVGPMVMTILANHLLTAVGWRDGYLLLTIPMIAVVLPMQSSARTRLNFTGRN
jgi:MFS family permease